MSLLVYYVNAWCLFRCVYFTCCKVESINIDLLVDAQVELTPLALLEVRELEWFIMIFMLAFGLLPSITALLLYTFILLLSGLAFAFVRTFLHPIDHLI